MRKQLPPRSRRLTAQNSFLLEKFQIYRKNISPGIPREKVYLCGVKIDLSKYLHTTQHIIWILGLFAVMVAPFGGYRQGQRLQN